MVRNLSKNLILQNKTIPYTLRKSGRARRMRLAVYRDGSVVLTTPSRFAESLAENFIYRKASWLISKLQFFSTLPAPVANGTANPIARYGRREYVKYKEDARVLVARRLEAINTSLGHSYNRVSIRNQKTCWGSCSRKGNLNFNYKILFLPAHLQDYVIVHELAHLKEFNHSPRFWELVARVTPDHKSAKKELRSFSL